jgi:hypothetical protein
MQKIAINTVILAALTALSGCVPGPSPILAAKTVAKYGNGGMDPGESCGTCPADCRVVPCPESGEKVAFDVLLSVPFDESATSVTTLVGYDGNLLRFPGNGLTPEAQKRVQNRPKGASTYASALGAAVRVVQTKNDGLANGGIYSVVLDRCKDARNTTAADLTCTVEGCAGKFGLIDGCSCSVEPSRGLDVSDLGSKQN